ncbi:deoxynucleoside triphosphate triphosphohydrolase SAMHD1 homolog isoform X1 [Labrus bergylta]|uniref:deoxynucleoside triphosphate triphosphohydrolase SAMHD1 homolog isoform X1 n=1 Tax=Labrus bergylta TaxID=56723 RepID=UPI003313A146
MYHLFYTRHCLHKRACQHRVSQIIQEMIAEAFLKADDHIQIEGSGGRMFTLSTAFKNMEAYTKLTDNVFEEILKSSCSELEKAREILQNIISRKSYKFVGETKPKDPIQDWESLIPSWKKGLAEGERNLTPKDFEILVIEMDYGMDDKDPIQHVHFYSKSELDKAKLMPEEKLVALCQPRLHPAERPDIPAELRRKRRGCRAGVKCREKKRRYKPSVPSLIMGNVRSLPNKMEELTALTRLQREYRECSIMQFTETWLNELTPDTLVTLDGFQLVRADRSARESGKKKGGGIAMYVNERWCNSGHITVKEQRCTKDVELLAVSIRPYYLPREFSHVIAVTVYIPPLGRRCCSL